MPMVLQTYQLRFGTQVSVSLFILIETNTVFIKLIFFDVFMYFKLR